MAFHGTFEHSLDVKHRLTVPSKFRSALSGRVILAKAIDPCVSVYPAQTYEAMTQAALADLNPFSPEARELKRVLFANATDVELDSAGRVMVPPRYREHAGIDRDVVITGAGDCLELWDATAWASYDSDLTERAPELTARLGHPA